MNSLTKCPVRKSLKIVGGKWSMLIIYYLAKPQRYSGLKTSIPDISEKMLIQNLKNLEKFKIVKRKNYNQIPPKVVYSLTALGKRFLKLMPALISLGKKL